MSVDLWSNIVAEGSSTYAGQRDVNTQSILNTIDNFIVWQNSQDNDRKFDHYHPSALGHCLRLMQYQRYADMGLIPTVKKDTEAPMIRVWQNGHYMHDRWRNYFEQIGILKGVWTCNNILCNFFKDNGKTLVENKVKMDEVILDHKKLPSRIYGLNELQGVFKPQQCDCGCRDFTYHEILVKDDEMNILGHCDMVVDFSKLKHSDSSVMSNINLLPQNPIVIDMKTVKDIGYKKVLKSGPSLEYKIQLTIYANILNCDFGVLIYENKNDQQCISFKIEKNTNTVYKEVKRQLKAMNEAANDKSKTYKLPPPRPESRDSFECSYCPYSKTCFKSDIWSSPNFDTLRREFYGNLLQKD
jgi:CRISPR/Cas system-associated exonuclease Cas4 (RecB family)